MSGPELDTGELHRWIGREDATEEFLTETLAEKFHATLNLRGPVPREGDPAPPLIHFCLCQPAAQTSDLGGDGHLARGVFLPPVALPRRMWAAGDLHFLGDLKVGQLVKRHSRIADITIKSGKSGVLCFVKVDHQIEVDGSIRIKEQQTIVYRDVAPAPAKNDLPTSPPAPTGIVSEAITPTPPLLFRYSAITFNSHRIHYDRTYATNAEGYPGLVVHGPLQATLLIGLATRSAGGVAPSRFAFRAVTPIFDNEEFVLSAAARADNRLELWSARRGGPVAMRAEAYWS